MTRMALREPALVKQVERWARETGRPVEKVLEIAVLTLLQRLSPHEQLRVITLALPEVERGLAEAPQIPKPFEHEQVEQPATEMLFKQRLLAAGLLMEIRPPIPHLSPNSRVLIPVEGKPLSEMIVEERR